MKRRALGLAVAAGIGLLAAGSGIAKADTVTPNSYNFTSFTATGGGYGAVDKNSTTYSVGSVPFSTIYDFTATNDASKKVVVSALQSSDSFKTSSVAGVSYGWQGLGVASAGDDKEILYGNGSYMDSTGQGERLVFDFGTAQSLSTVTFTFAEATDYAQIGLYLASNPQSPLATFPLGLGVLQPGGDREWTVQFKPALSVTKFYLGAVDNPSGQDSSFKVEKFNVVKGADEAVVVPTPTAGMAGLAMLSVLGTVHYIRRRRDQA